MDYVELEDFRRSYRSTAIACGAGVVMLFARALLVYWWAPPLVLALTGLLALATVYAVSYLPLYLRISVERRKRFVWSVRTRLIATGALALLTTPLLGLDSRSWLLWAGAVGISLAGTLTSRAFLRKHRDEQDFPAIPALLLAGDLAALLLIASEPDVPTVAIVAGLTLAVAMNVLTADGAGRFVGAALAAAAFACVPNVAFFGELPLDWSLYAIPPVTYVAALLLVRSADARHAANVRKTVDDLSAFALVPPEDAMEMLATSTGILARNWNESPPIGPDAVARWYEENSEYYLYDLAQFHLAYKHIAFMLDVLGLARGRVLDFGAGIGDLALALARAGHDTVYVDVEGRTKAFARWRAERDWLPVEFASDVDEVDGTFDTIISLDVFEHLARPEPVIDELVARLAPGGRLVVTAYFGATKAHPMHFDHDLDLAAYLRAHGLRDAKTLAMRFLRSEFLGKSGVLVFEKPES